MSSMVCFNPECKVSFSERWIKGWRLRNHDFVNLCHRCGLIYEEGRFCEIFHKHASGWRCCETCGKRVHCGCIVSMHAFVVLDAGGVECMICARRNVTLTPNKICPPRPLPVWHAQLPVRSWNTTAGSTSNGFWYLGDDLSNKFLDDFSFGELLSLKDYGASFSSERNLTPSLSLVSDSLKQNGLTMYEFGKPVVSIGKDPVHQSSLKAGQCTPLSGLSSSSPLSSQADNRSGVCSVLSQQLNPQDTVRRQLSVCSHNVDSASKSQISNLKPAELRVRKELHALCWPKMSNEELQQISGSTQSVITPLFEKTLSASDAGRVGRLVLPKKYAEAYFPPIPQSEGLPLKVQDIYGKEWIFQFRFWLNNNSRMYVLEGINNCVQSLQLQAGDTISFSRREPDGELILGFKKASSGPQANQGSHAIKCGNEVLSGRDASNQKPKHKDDSTKSHLKGCVANKSTRSSSCIPIKRKSCMLNSKKKHARVNNMDFLGIKATLEEAQGLFRSPLNHVPHVVVIEEFEFEEYEDAPVIGRPTIIVRDSLGQNIQLAQCDNCSKWRKLPFDSLLPARWTCAENIWNPERSSCKASQEISAKRLEKLLSTNNPESTGAGACKKLQHAEFDAHGFEDSEVLDNVAIEEFSEVGLASTRPTTKHPRHKLGCSCIVCSQAPSGGPKHRQNCHCKVCLMVRRRFQSLMFNRGKNQSKKRSSIQKCKSLGRLKSSKRTHPGVDLQDSSDKGYANISINSQIDLNTQPEREDGSTCCNSTTFKKSVQDAPREGWMQS